MSPLPVLTTVAAAGGLDADVAGAGRDRRAPPASPISTSPEPLLTLRSPATSSTRIVAGAGLDEQVALDGVDDDVAGAAAQLAVAGPALELDVGAAGADRRVAAAPGRRPRRAARCRRRCRRGRARSTRDRVAALLDDRRRRRACPRPGRWSRWSRCSATSTLPLLISTTGRPGWWVSKRYSGMAVLLVWCVVKGVLDRRAGARLRVGAGPWCLGWAGLRPSRSSAGRALPPNGPCPPNGSLPPTNGRLDRSMSTLIAPSRVAARTTLTSQVLSEWPDRAANSSALVLTDSGSRRVIRAMPPSSSSSAPGGAAGRAGPAAPAARRVRRRRRRARGRRAGRRRRRRASRR